MPPIGTTFSRPVNALPPGLTVVGNTVSSGVVESGGVTVVPLTVVESVVVVSVSVVLPPGATWEQSKFRRSETQPERCAWGRVGEVWLGGGECLTCHNVHSRRSRAGFSSYGWLGAGGYLFGSSEHCLDL